MEMTPAYKLPFRVPAGLELLLSVEKGSLSPLGEYALFLLQQSQTVLQSF